MEKIWIIVTDKEEIYRLVVEQNTNKLSMSNQSSFVIGHIVGAIGPYGNNNVVDKIRDGSANHETLGLTHNDVDEEMDTLLESLQYAKLAK